MKKRTVAIIIIFFALTLYWVEYSPWSSAELAKYNNGYGTFDMKSYDSKTVYEVLNQTQPEGFTIYRLYLIGDYLFIAAFGALQMMLSLRAYQWTKKKSLIRLAIGVPVFRGICDLVENSIILFIINTYPENHNGLISIASIATTCKLVMIVVWLVMFLLGIGMKTFKHIQGSSNKNNPNV